MSEMSETPLRNRFTFWILDDQAKTEQVESAESFNEKLKPIVSFGTVGQFWDVFQYMQKPSEYQPQNDIYLFKEGIKPLWEDPLNEKGGYFTIKIDKQRGNKVWQNAILACISPQREVASCINGVRLKTKESLQIIQIWMNESAQQRMPELKQYLKDSLQITEDKVYAFFLFSFMLKNLKDKEKKQAPPFSKGRQK